MRTYRDIPAVKAELESIECDWCHLVFETEKAFNGENDPYDDNMFTFEIREGTSFPEGAYGKRWTFDLCFACRRRLLQELMQMKISIQREDY